jgi:3-deoxy-D-manno-octulosonic-acid transferase
METEVWPNLIAVCNARKVPVVLANARLSERSLRKATRLGSLLLTRRAASRWSPRRRRPMPSACVRWACSVEVTGSIKFDVVVPEAALAIGARCAPPSARVRCCCAPPPAKAKKS